MTNWRDCSVPDGIDCRHASDGLMREDDVKLVHGDPCPYRSRLHASWHGRDWDQPTWDELQAPGCAG